MININKYNQIFRTLSVVNNGDVLFVADKVCLMTLFAVAKLTHNRAGNSLSLRLNN